MSLNYVSKQTAGTTPFYFIMLAMQRLNAYETKKCVYSWNAIVLQMLKTGILKKRIEYKKWIWILEI